MKRKTYFKGTERVASVKLGSNKYEVIMHYYTTIPNCGKLNYIQVVKNRKKIANFQDREIAERRMMAEAMMDINQTTLKL